jgi:hypothetical protein
MNNNFDAKIRRILNEELIRRLMTKYFEDKDIAVEDFDRNIYPPILQDITYRIPQFAGKIEIVPHIEDMNPATGRIRLGWNLFVLGNKRMDIGESSHKNVAELKLNIAGPSAHSTAKKEASPNRLIEFISKMLSKSEAGYIEKGIDKPVAEPGGQVGNSAQFYAGSQGFERNRPVL